MFISSSIRPASDTERDREREREREQERETGDSCVSELALHLHVITNNEDLSLVI